MLVCLCGRAVLRGACIVTENNILDWLRGCIPLHCQALTRGSDLGWVCLVQVRLGSVWSGSSPLREVLFVIEWQVVIIKRREP